LGGGLLEENIEYYAKRDVAVKPSGLKDSAEENRRREKNVGGGREIDFGGEV